MPPAPAPPPVPAEDVGGVAGILGGVAGVCGDLGNLLSSIECGEKTSGGTLLEGLSADFEKLYAGVFGGVNAAGGAPKPEAGTALVDWVSEEGGIADPKLDSDFCGALEETKGFCSAWAGLLVNESGSPVEVEGAILGIPVGAGIASMIDFGSCTDAPEDDPGPPD